MKVCTQCLIDKPLSEFYHKGKKSDGRLMTECKPCFNSRMMERYETKVQQLLLLKGGSCVKCGYNKCIAALEFHHRDPTQKEFQISKRWSMTDEAVKKEIDKCDLLCANCHREVHYEMRVAGATV